MGEEKPDEELMGKRKSSPRLSTASSDADDLILSALWAIIHFTPKKYYAAPCNGAHAFIIQGKVWYDRQRQ
ncbi:single-stranded DNA-binding protein [Paenibacillus glycanilyticus]|uniref:Uncharacterized protein n=1 Tax=Paenibacillus glycanilyticus TaxID=126569 RepID=A0ABQ6GJT9_9BACL|nr:single-stranded DNA-binding protein [Paenibacillus glycanilyticus]GLX71199.1 hypothetical protein MU1_55480 [Paenibacillus glycanilyticus]